MLPAQVSYWTLEEGKRHNTNVEQESYRHNVAMEQYNREELARKREEMEANIRLRERELEEQHRSNVAREMYNAQVAQYNYLSISETQRHNASMEAINLEHNRATEQLQSQNIDLGFTNAGINSRRTDIQQKQVDQQYEISKGQLTQGWVNTGGNLVKTGAGLITTFLKVFG